MPIPVIIANSGSFGINTDILETNLINQIILFAGLFKFGGKFLGNGLEQRQAEIITCVEDSEKLLNEATRKLEEAKKQLSQARVIIEEIKNETRLTKSKLLENDYVQAKSELERRFLSTVIILQSRERLILNEIKQNISLLALQQVITKIEIGTDLEINQHSYMNKSIDMLSVVNKN